MLRSTVTRLRSSAGLKVAAAGAAAAAAASFAMPAAECQSKDGAYVEIRSSVFVINGFYMAMREKYTKPSASIYYYLVEWDPATPWVAQVAPGELPGCLSAASVASVASPLAWL